jgi:putative drug exporter of the RND superfamily
VVVKMLALGLGVSIIVDASIIRLLVVPATMFLMGRANWWTPRWLSRMPELLEPADLPRRRGLERWPRHAARVRTAVRPRPGA